MNTSFDVNEWLNLFVQKLIGHFGDRLLYVGHVGSWVRGEAGPQSDIDLNIILDRVDWEDLIAYRALVQEMPNHEKACGFLGSRQEIAAWPRHELFHFMLGCKILHGRLDEEIAWPTKKEIGDYIRNSSSAILHEIRHRTIYGGDRSQEVHDLAMAYKFIFFILQAWLAYDRDALVLTKKEVLQTLTRDLDREILTLSIQWKELENDRKERPDFYYERLATWCRDMLLRLECAVE